MDDLFEKLRAETPVNKNIRPPKISQDYMGYKPVNDVDLFCQEEDGKNENIIKTNDKNKSTDSNKDAHNNSSEKINKTTNIKINDKHSEEKLKICEKKISKRLPVLKKFVVRLKRLNMEDYIKNGSTSISEKTNASKTITSTPLEKTKKKTEINIIKKNEPELRNKNRQKTSTPCVKVPTPKYEKNKRNIKNGPQIETDNDAQKPMRKNSGSKITTTATTPEPKKRVMKSRKESEKEEESPKMHKNNSNAGKSSTSEQKKEKMKNNNNNNNKQKIEVEIEKCSTEKQTSKTHEQNKLKHKREFEDEGRAFKKAKTNIRLSEEIKENTHKNTKKYKTEKLTEKLDEDIIALNKKIYGKHFFQLKVRVERCKPNSAAKRSQKNRKNLSVSFLEEVEVISDDTAQTADKTVIDNMEKPEKKSPVVVNDVETESCLKEIQVANDTSNELFDNNENAEDELMSLKIDDSSSNHASLEDISSDDLPSSEIFSESLNELSYVNGFNGFEQVDDIEKEENLPETSSNDQTNEKETLKSDEVDEDVADEVLEEEEEKITNEKETLKLDEVDVADEVVEEEVEEEEEKITKVVDEEKAAEEEEEEETAAAEEEEKAAAEEEEEKAAAEEEDDEESFKSACLDEHNDKDSESIKLSVSLADINEPQDELMQEDIDMESLVELNIDENVNADANDNDNEHMDTDDDEVASKLVMAEDVTGLLDGIETASEKISPLEVDKLNATIALIDDSHPAAAELSLDNETLGVDTTEAKSIVDSIVNETMH